MTSVTYGKWLNQELTSLVYGSAKAYRAVTSSAVYFTDISYSVRI